MIYREEFPVLTVRPMAISWVFDTSCCGFAEEV